MSFWTCNPEWQKPPAWLALALAIVIVSICPGGSQLVASESMNRLPMLPVRQHGSGFYITGVFKHATRPTKGAFPLVASNCMFRSDRPLQRGPRP